MPYSILLHYSNPLEMVCCKKKKGNVDMADLKKDIVIDDHKIPLNELLDRLNTDLTKGLSSDEAAHRLAVNGPNSLTPPNKKSMFGLFCKDVFGGFNGLLWVAGVLSIIAYIMDVVQSPDANDVPKDNLFMGVVLIFAVIVTGLFSFYMDRKSIIIMDAFSNLIPPHAHVLRDGVEKDIAVDCVVIGDIVFVSGGDKVPADMRVVEGRGLKVDNSSLTGESEPQTRTPEFTHDNPLESKNIALFSTNVVEGTSKGVVILTGDKTVMGRIAALTQNVETSKTPISKEINNFVKVSAGVAFFVGTMFFILACVMGNGWMQCIIYFIGMVVANVPEGIVVTVTVSLTLTAVKMRKKFCLAKKLEGVETLGSTSTICSDKTGTLTQNKMTVTHMWVNGEIELTDLPTPGQGQSDTKSTKSVTRKTKMDASMYVLTRCASLCSRATMKKNEEKGGEMTFTGDASELAIMKYCDIMQLEGIVQYRQKFPKEAEIPFNSTNKFQVSVHRTPKDTFIVQLKGAPEKVLAMCSTISLHDEDCELNELYKDNFQTAYETLGGFGERVFGFADLELDPVKFPKDFKFDSENKNFPLEGLRFLGLLSMIDPPRPGVPHAVRMCQSAGIKVVMVTGDHPITARAIAEQVHIIEEGVEVNALVEDDEDAKENEEYGKGRLKECTAVVVHGEQLKKMSSETLHQIVSNYEQVVFARTSPAQKLQIVESYQQSGQIVAVTGDGVNDAPALRKADIGIAMGIAGTDVSKQAADMILLNDNFASIVFGVEEGRLIFDNLKKAISYVLTSNVPEITPFMSYVIFGIPLPMSIMTILMIDLGTDLWPAISLAYEHPESDIMLRPPRDARFDRLVNHRLVVYSYLQIGSIQMCAGFTGYFVNMAYYGFLPGRLLGIREEWDDKSNQDLEDSFGQQWSYEERKSLEACCQGLTFLCIVIVQWADLFAAKTRKNSIVVQGFGNQVLNWSVPFTACLATFLLYTPGINELLGIHRVRLETVMVCLPFALFIIMYDELRTWAIRRWPGGWVYKETYY